MTLASHGDMFQSVPRATIGRSCVWRQRKRLQSGEITPNRSLRRSVWPPWNRYDRTKFLQVSTVRAATVEPSVRALSRQTVVSRAQSGSLVAWTRLRQYVCMPPLAVMMQKRCARGPAFVFT